MIECARKRSGRYNRTYGMHEVTHTDGRQCDHVPKGHGNASVYGWCPFKDDPAKCPNFISAESD